MTLLDYFLERVHVRSLAWMQKVCFAVEMLLEYIDTLEQAQLSVEGVFRLFAQRLHSGTVGLDGADPSGLYWPPRKAEETNRLLERLAQFSDWATARKNARPLNAVTLEPRRYEHNLSVAAFEHRRVRAFLGHTYKLDPNRPIVRAVGKKLEPSVIEVEPVRRFPDHDFKKFLTEGFIRRGMSGTVDPAQRLNLRDMLITLLLHGGGLRESEPFHLWVQDVATDPLDPTKALVRVYHPSEGACPDDWLDHRGLPMKKSRAEYLARRYGLSPRNEIMGSQHAGWKNPTLDSKHGRFMQVHWFPEDLGRVFQVLWRSYLSLRVQFKCDHHPYAFIAMNQTHGGDPYAIGTYIKAHERACRRIGLVPAKYNGTSPHGHRHAFGHRLTEGAVDPVIRQRLMHHQQLASQEVYTRPQFKDATRALQQAQDRLDALPVGSSRKNEFSTKQLMEIGFESIDPDGLLSGPSPKLLRAQLL